MNRLRGMRRRYSLVSGAGAACVGSVLAILLAAPSPQAATACEHQLVDRPSIGLVLGGGGARGSAHIGVIRALEEMRIPVDYIAGTSMGALVGALHATGMDAGELERVLLEINWDDLFQDETDRRDRSFRRKRDDDLALFGPKLGIGRDAALVPTGAISGQKITFLFETLVKQRTRVNDFSTLPVPFRAVATDLVTGNAVVLDEGNLALAMRASMSVPGVFDPVQWQDYLLVDGGLVNNIPVDVARAMGADIVIAVNVGTGLTPREELTDVLSVAGQLTNFMTNNNAARSLQTLGRQDILVTPPLGTTVTSADFGKVKEGVALGYQAATEARKSLQRLAVSEADYRNYRESIAQCISAPRQVQFVRLDNRSRFDDAVILERITVAAGDVLDIEAIQSDIDTIYGLGLLEQVRYEVVEEAGGTGILISVEGDARGTQLVETGLDLSDGWEGSSYNLRIGYLNTGIDEYGSELRLLTQWGEDPALLVELYKYFDPRLEWFILGQLFSERRSYTDFDDRGNALLESKVEQIGGLLGAGREFGRHARLVLGVRLFSGHTDVRVGPPDTEDYDFEGGEYVFNGVWDRLDSVYFPGDGTLATLSYRNSDEALGADAEYEQILLEALTAKSYGRHAVYGGLRYYDTLDDEAPLYAQFRAGGFTNLSGLQVGELAGQNYGMVLGGYRYHVAGSGLLPAYLGGTLEYGQMADDTADLFDDGILNGSLYFAYRSPIGPLYLGAGLAEGGRRTYFIRIGNVFGSSDIVQ
jgi:NTE family protein